MKPVKNKLLLRIIYLLHSVHWGITPPSQKHYPFFLANPPLNQQTVQAPPLLGNPPSLLVVRETPA